MEVYLTKNANGLLIPTYDSDHESCKKIAFGETVKAEITKPRNIGFHRKFFALLNMAFNNQDEYDTFEDFRAVMIMKAGFFKQIATDRGLVYFPKSISFAKMDELEFGDLYSKMIDVVIKILSITEENIEQEIINFM